MLIVNNTQKRSLEEQVAYLTNLVSAILTSNEILAKFGIRVVGQVATEEDLNEQFPASEYTGEYGDSVLVGSDAPYDYYVFTRPFSGQTHGEWLNIGVFPAPGPDGPQGPEGQPGEKGERGNFWYSGVGRPGATVLNPIEGDCYFETNTNNVWQYRMSEWVAIATLKGDPGESIVGPAGPAGPIVDIIGKLDNFSQLPSTPEAIALFVSQYGRQGAYLIPKNGVPGERLEVYGLTGPDDNLSWSNLGVFSSGTVVYYQGNPIDTLNIDNYIRTIKTPLNNTRYVYTGYNENVSLRKVTANTFEPDTFPWRGAGGHLKVPATPTDPNHCASKSYVDQKITSLLDQLMSVIESYH